MIDIDRMSKDFNDYGQPIGLPVENWHIPEMPSSESMVGRYCRLEALNVDKHAEQLYEGILLDKDGRDWTYLYHGPFENFKSYSDWLRVVEGKEDPIFFAILDGKTGRAVGSASYMRIFPESGSIEVGAIHFSPILQATPAATEAMYLMMKRVFELGYRRYEWKCNALNIPSRRAALRLGFSFEGVFRQAAVVKGRNRDTAWYAIIDSEWPLIRDALEKWLSPLNFTSEGLQRISLRELTLPIVKTVG